MSFKITIRDLTVRAEVSLEADSAAVLRALIQGLADRVAAQSDFLSRRAEVPAATAPSEPSAAAADTPPPSSDCAPVAADTVSAPSGRRQSGELRAKRLALAAALAAGPKSAGALAAAIGAKNGGITYLLQHEWFSKDGDSRRAPYILTDAGRLALAEVAVWPPVEPPPAETVEYVADRAETPVPEQAAPVKPRPELTAAERAREQCRLMCAAIVSAGRPLDAYEIAKETGLPLESVQKRLKSSGPNGLTSGFRYFARSQRDSDKWGCTNSGHELAQEEVQ